MKPQLIEIVGMKDAYSLDTRISRRNDATKWLISKNPNEPEIQGMSITIVQVPAGYDRTIRLDYNQLRKFLGYRYVAYSYIAPFNLRGRRVTAYYRRKKLGGIQLKSTKCLARTSWISAIY